jgi:hypothetical protein
MKADVIFRKAYDYERTILARMAKWESSGQAVALFVDEQYPAAYVTQLLPPAFIRRVVAVKDAQDFAQITDLVHEMNKYYKMAVIADHDGDEKAYKGPMNRFAVCVKDVLYARHVLKQSWESINDFKKSPFDYIPLISVKTKWDQTLTNLQKEEKLCEYGTVLLANGIQNEFKHGTLYGQIDGIRKYGNAPGLIIRSPTGTHHKMHLKFKDPELKTKTLACGYIISNGEFDVFKTKPRTRKRQIQDIREQINLPIYTANRTFWKAKANEMS